MSCDHDAWGEPDKLGGTRPSEPVQASAQRLLLMYVHQLAMRISSAPDTVV